MFRQGSILAVVITAFLLLLIEPTPSTAQDADSIDAGASSTATTQAAAVDPVQSVEQATGTIRELVNGFYAFLPKIVIAVVILVLGVFLAKALRWTYRRYLHRTQRGASLVALSQIGIVLVTLVIAISILVGDVRAIVGSLGLVGLALSWALQAPIESFTGWLLNTFRGYYRVGDRIEVGDVFGDVYKIDFLTTTVWEAGGPGKSVAAAQPTGALVTFPNSEVLRANIVNYSADFPFVWDEVTFGLANESDLSYSVDVIRRKAEEVIGEQMASSIQEYRRLLIRQGLAYDVDDKPQVYLSLTDSWTNCTVRYLVGVRARRKWSSEMIEKISRETSLPEHKGKIIGGLPRQEAIVHVSQ